ncbi:MAG: UPF0182 family protein [Gemmatimonadales bacterium]
MRAPGRWIAGVVAAAVAALVLGRLLVGILADQWWAASVAPAAAGPMLRLHALRWAIEAVAVGLAAAWLAAHLLFVVRTVHRVEIPRYLGNLEFRETVRRRTLLLLVLALALLLGLLTGLGASRGWQAFVLWLGDVRYGIADPALARDLGAYVGRVPVLLQLQGFAVRLGVVGLAATALAYLLIGGLRWNEGRLAVSEYARRHLAVLLVALALAIGWGHYLDPARWISGPRGSGLGAMPWRLLEVGSSAMLGVTLGTAMLSASWAWGARSLLVGASWAVLLAASVGARTILPGAAGTGPALIDPATRRGIDAVAWGIDGLEREWEGGPVQAPGLWNPAMVLRVAAADTGEPAAVSPGLIRGPGRSRPVWYAIRIAGQDPGVVAIADDRVTSSGGAMSYRAGDSLAYPGVVTWKPLRDAAAFPGALAVTLDTTGAGIALGGSLRRAVLAWALQEPAVLRRRGAVVGWRRDPAQRLGKLAPWATWSAPALVEWEGRPAWASLGLVRLPSFAASTRSSRTEPSLGGIEVGFVGLVSLVDGRARMFLAPGAGPASQALARLGGGFVEPVESLPDELLDVLPYPGELFQAQVAVVADGPVAAGRQTAPGLSGVAWQRDREGRPVPAAPFEDSTSRNVTALLLGELMGGRPRPVLLRGGPVPGPAPATLMARWSRFPVYEQLRDSVEAAGGRLEAGPVRYRPEADLLSAWQVHFATRRDQRPSILWVSVAAGDRMGAGRDLAGAIRNLGGLGAPVPAWLGGSRVDEARRWLERADSALRAGDWAAFGRAFEALRAVLDAQRADTAAP